MTRPRSAASVASSRTNLSAGGQLDHPCDVKSSTTTGFGPSDCSRVVAAIVAIVPNVSAATTPAAIHPLRIAQV